MPLRSASFFIADFPIANFRDIFPVRFFDARKNHGMLRARLLSMEKLKIKLVGEDGNAFAILGRCRRAMRQAGRSQDEVDQFTAEATSGDYDHLLSVVLRYFDEEGE